MDYEIYQVFSEGEDKSRGVDNVEAFDEAVKM